MLYHTYIQEESTEWARRTVDVASATEDAAAINDMHDRVMKNQTLFAVDAPDGEHDLEDVVSRYVYHHYIHTSSYPTIALPTLGTYS